VTTSGSLTCATSSSLTSCRCLVDIHTLAFFIVVVIIVITPSQCVNLILNIHLLALQQRIDNGA
jgi:hypothetical protein